jgi:hypothetical protein
MTHRFALFLIALCALPAWAPAQNDPKSAAPAVCVAAKDVEQVHLIGLWRAEFGGIAQGATVLLEKSREFAEGLAGGINRDGVKALVAGDVDGGKLELEESDDGTAITATWAGNVVEASCGKEIRGIWRSSRGIERTFVLRKASGW